MIVGGHYLHADQSFNGSLKSVKFWAQEVAWPMPESAEASLGPKAGGHLPDGDSDAASCDTADVESWDAESWDAESSWDGLGLAPAGEREDAAAAGPDPEAPRAPRARPQQEPGGGPLLA